MKDKITRLFLSDEGKAVQNDILRAIDEYSMADSLNRGVLVGFSGGADSVMLLSFLAYFSDFGTRFPLLAVHVNHSIRGDEADRDEAFAKSFCNSLGIEFLSVKIDVPTLAAETKTGLEECARNCRYLEFQ
jgi:tRNA(Ile)-lysidine synthase